MIYVNPLQGTTSFVHPQQYPQQYPLPGQVVVPSYAPVDPYGRVLPTTSYTFPPANPVLRKTWEENQRRWNQPLDWRKEQRVTKRQIPKSTLEAILKSQRAQKLGMTAMKAQDFGQAYMHFKKAVEAAPDQMEPRVQFGIVLITIGQFERASRFLKETATLLDSQWWHEGHSLDAIYTKENFVAKDAAKGRLVQWAREDIRDPK